MAAIGFNLGGYAHLIAAVLGLSALLATSAVAFSVVKWLGASYLVYLGISVLRSRSTPVEVSAQGVPARSAKTILWQAFLSDVLNPKVAMFVLALLPQFVDAQSAHPTLQILFLGVTLNFIALTGNIGLVYLSAAVTSALRRNTSVTEWLRKAMGVTFVTLGLRLAFEKN